MFFAQLHVDQRNVIIAVGASFYLCSVNIQNKMAAGSDRFLQWNAQISMSINTNLCREIYGISGMILTENHAFPIVISNATSELIQFSPKPDSVCGIWKGKNKSVTYGVCL